MQIVRGKISSVRFGAGGRRNDEVGLTIIFDTDGGQLTSFIGWWNTDQECSEVERNRMYANIVRSVDSLFKKANVSELEHLVNMPVACTTDGTFVTEFRVLTEILD